MYRQTKRQRRDNPSSWLDCETLTAVPNVVLQHNDEESSGRGGDGGIPLPSIVRTPITPAHVQELFVERLNKELLQKYYRKRNDVQDSTSLSRRWLQQRRVLQQRMRVGINACNRACLNSLMTTKPLLIVVVHPSPQDPVTPMVHIPALCPAHAIPLLLLSSSGAHSSLTQQLKMKRVSVITFVPLDNAVMIAAAAPATTATAATTTPPMATTTECVENKTTGQTNMDDDGYFDDDEVKKEVHTAVDSFVSYVVQKWVSSD